MKLVFYLLIFLNLSNFTYSNTIFYLTKIPNLVIHDLTASNGIKYLKAEKSFRVGIVNSNVQCDVADNQDIDDKFKTIKDNFNKYDKNFLEKINLKYIILCKNLMVSNIKTAGVPNHIVKTLIVDVNSDSRYFERSLHHELFHMINDSYKNLFSYDNWKKLNDLEFSYAECSTCSNRSGLSLINNTQGFLTEYSMSTPSEDMAEIFSFLMTNKDKLLEISFKDTVVKNKILFLKEEILKIDNKFKFE
tara:strand:- start:287 stop:1027 length:741 start_codon:yes stop_codon:yes gene_type:complete